MKRTLLSLVSVSILALGCGHAALETGAATPAPAREFVDANAPAEATPSVADATPDAAATTPARAPGDFVVYRFTGTFRKAPLTLSQRVVARAGSVITIDLSATEGKQRDDLRVRVDEASATHNEILSVARLDHGVEKAATLEAYEALMARTALAADANEALVGTEDVTVEIAGASVPAKRTTYRVRVGRLSATMKTFESASFAWGDVGGEITATNGKVLYRAEVIESGHSDATAHAALTE